ncbi:MAG TPA: oligoendopeptidase F [Candidatus Scybalocola faecipullorum]|nr:oligoendopeptidase F [Candidatus Scybalocola faecipullorum]
MPAKKLPARSQVQTENTWKMEDIYPSDADWKKEYEALEAQIPKISQYEGRLGESAKVLLEYLQLRDRLSLMAERLSVYAGQKSHEDLGNSKYQDLVSQAASLTSKLMEAASFEDPQLLSVGREKIEQFISEEKGLELYRQSLSNTLRMQPHTLSSEMEAMLSQLSEFADTPYNVFAMFNNADLKFPTVKDEDGSEVEITHGRYGTLMESSDRTVRKAAFEGMYHTYEKYKNTLAAVYAGNVKKEIFYAKARKYDSPRQMRLDANAVDVSVYDRLIETVHEYLPVMYEYVALRKKMLGVDELHMYDVYAPIVGDVKLHFSFEEAKKIVLEGLKPLGGDYTALLKEGFENRWIDVYENQGKRSGAYSWGVYGVHPYVLLNYQGTLDNVFTLAHEMGHALHSHYSDTNQAYVNAGYCIFVAEVASTCNEVLLMNHMINTAKDDRVKAAILNHYLDTFKGTLFRQTMFAEFEKITYEMAQRGETLTPDALCKVYHDLNVLYFGPDMVIDKEIDMEWSRIPHFYTPFYVYQYATGISAASAFAKDILENGPEAAENYKNKFLKGGCSKYPVDLLADAGVDMRTKVPVQKALETFKFVLQELKALLK